MNGKSGPKAAPRVSPPSLTADQSNTTALPGDCAHGLDARWCASCKAPPAPRPPVVGLTGAEAAKAAGITYRQLDYWARTGLVVPTVPAAGPGTQRRYLAADVDALRVVARLLTDGRSLAWVRTLKRRAGADWPVVVELLDDGAGVGAVLELLGERVAA